MSAQYVVVGLLVFVAVVYITVKFVRVLKGKESGCSSCPGCVLKDVKSDEEKKACTGPEDGNSEKSENDGQQ